MPYTLVQKNTLTSYGLTIVAGLPFPVTLSEKIEALQGSLEETLPDQFLWYGSDHLHITFAAPLRGRYRQERQCQSSDNNSKRKSVEC